MKQQIDRFLFGKYDIGYSAFCILTSKLLTIKWYPTTTVWEFPWFILGYIFSLKMAKTKMLFGSEWKSWLILWTINWFRICTNFTFLAFLYNPHHYFFEISSLDQQWWLYKKSWILPLFVPKPLKNKVQPVWGTFRDILIWSVDLSNLDFW